MRGFGLARYLNRHPATAFSAVFEMNAIGLWLFVSSWDSFILSNHQALG
ncbi:hypothetical protein [Hyphomonas sp. CACIAM 19H1]|nr:hypothetical protein [Hyphomonas sp. CACIAM 19H1]